MSQELFEERKIICVTCPQGCSLNVTVKNGGELISVTGNRCRRGEGYARMEMADPRRMVASTVRILGGIHPLLPVALSAPFPKGRINELSDVLRTIEVDAPIMVGEIILENVLDTGINILASRNMDKIERQA